MNSMVIQFHDKRRLSWIEKDDIIRLKKRDDKAHEHLYDAYHKYEHQKDENGRFMIKLQELRVLYSDYDRRYTYRKKYFCQAKAGVGYTRNPKDIRVFKTHDKLAAIHLASIFANYMGADYIVSVVDRYMNGHETYILTKEHDVLKRIIVVNN